MRGYPAAPGRPGIAAPTCRPATTFALVRASGSFMIKLWVARTTPLHFSRDHPCESQKNRPNPGDTPASYPETT